MALEMAGHGDLLEYIKLRGAIPEEKSKRMFLQLASAVEYLHAKDIIHRSGQAWSSIADAGCLKSVHVRNVFQGP